MLGRAVARLRQLFPQQAGSTSQERSHSFLFSEECSLGAHGLLRFRTIDVLLGTSGVGVCVSVVSNSPGMLYLFLFLFLATTLPQVTLVPTQKGGRTIAPSLLSATGGTG